MGERASTRIERDSFGPIEVPADRYWGAQTQRSIELFRIGTERMPEPLVRAFGVQKKAAALANMALGELDAKLGAAVVRACDEVISGKLVDHFPLLVWQTGSGTQTNMNANEVIANRANEMLGEPLGQRKPVHPNDHVNRGQSSNDSFPTAMHIATVAEIHDTLLPGLARLHEVLQAKATEFAGVVKLGRTQLQDAVPMTLGQEFSTYATMLGEDEERLKEAALLIREINLGATAIGTGINAHPDYAGLVCRRLAEITGIPVVTAPNLIEATQDCGAFIQLSGVLKRVAAKLSKVCNDLRLLSSGPRAGFGEINLPPRQAGSSIMPGKVNPVIPEVVNQIAFEVIGNDMTVTFAAEAGQLQLNAFEPIIAHSLFKSVLHLTKGCVVLADRCVDGITANRDALRASVERSIGIVTALNPYIGYAHATDVAAEAHASGRGVAEIVLERGLMTAEALAEVLRPEVLTRPRALPARKLA
ncbi:aspartate ammonia-lyase [Zoogloea sp.]|uniref:aspartate ammonia-lyase n=1 Tax=Zoogloea sp. TaxID=49181 RepID=UPI001ACFB0B7|nr:aspartate ammonia-lyase [Zoogloea sp.]MBN8285697.1 aspartate ammonia-lyase [Zoogloea sp.]